MLVHRLLDAFFRTLDAVDAARDRVDRILGREPRPDPWAVEWPPPASAESPRDESFAATGAGPHDAAPESSGKMAGGQATDPASGAAVSQAAEEQGEDTSRDLSDAGRAAKKSPSRKAPAKKSKTSTKPTSAPAAKGTTKSATAKSAAAKTTSSSKRKGSVDRQGKDFDSPRARAVSEFVRENDFGVVSANAEYQGKKVLARVLWALHAAEEAGSEKGLTSADASALLHLSANIEVFATNLARACRDHAELIQETEMDGRSKRYKLTDDGKTAARELELA